MVSPLLSLLGILGAPQEPSTPQAPAEPEVPDIVSSGVPYPKSKYKEGIIGGPLRPGSTGGNILGALGDAFLVQAGRDRQYAPRLQQLRESEALQNYGQDPERALEQYTMLNPTGALQGFNQLRDNERMQSQAEDLHRARQDQYENTTHERGTAIIGASTKENYPQMRDQYYKYYAARGVTPPVELPTTFDEAQLKALRLAGVPATTQLQQENLSEYRQEQINQKKAADAARSAYYQQRIGIQKEETSRKTQADRNREKIQQENAVSNRIRASKPSSTKGGVAPGATKKFVWDPTKNKYVQQ